VESLADIFSSIIVWRGLVVAEEPPDEEHPYGHHKAEPIAAAVVSGMLLLAAGAIAFQSVREVAKPHHSPAAFTLVMLVIVVLIKESLFRFVHRESISVDSSAMRTDAWHHRSDAITSLAAGIGITVALIGGPSFAVADDIAAIFAAVVIAWNGWHLLLAAINELMDPAPRREMVDRIRRLAEAVPGVACVEKFRARKSGHYYFVEMHVEVDPQMTVQRSHDIAHDVKNRIRSKFPNVRDVLVHIEPAGQPRLNES
jgi:cation diffusion facilitator family transporter